MSERLLTQEEIDRLARAGARYPWSPFQTLKALDWIDGLKKRVRCSVSNDKFDVECYLTYPNEPERWCVSCFILKGPTP